MGFSVILWREKNPHKEGKSMTYNVRWETNPGILVKLDLVQQSGKIIERFHQRNNLGPVSII